MTDYPTMFEPKEKLVVSLAIRCRVEAEGWSARWICTYGSKAMTATISPRTGSVPEMPS
jgi:hypothetical protein